MIVIACGSPPPAPVRQATGIKICEVNQTEATIWTRITRDPLRVGDERPMPTVTYDRPEGEPDRPKVGNRDDYTPVVEFPDGSTVETIEGAVPGAPGEVRARFRSEGTNEWRETGWHEADPDRDFTAPIELAALRAGSRYELEVEARPAPDAAVSSTIRGGFMTAPAAADAEQVVFAVTTGTKYEHRDAASEGYKMYAAILELNPSFFVHTGDIVYYDALAKTLPLARWHWQRMYSLPSNVAFHRRVSSYFIKDDHDTWQNDSWPTMRTRHMGEFAFEQGRRVFLEQTGIRGKTYRTIRWGKDLQIWLPEGRDYRSPNTMPDGPEKSIWGAEQKAWFKETVEESDATFRLLISPTPIVGPDRFDDTVAGGFDKADNHSNEGFQTEGDEIRSLIAMQENMYVVCGDRHWQYVSQDVETGVREYSSGPASNEHAGGFSEAQRTGEHVYLNIVGGFLSGTVERVDGTPTLTFRHHDVDGEILNEDRLRAEE